jgi:small subunit ribosomal protein S14
MAKTSSIIKYRRSIELVDRYREKRLKLKEIIRHPSTSFEDREAAQRALAKIPRRGLPVQLRRRCELTGRSRAVYRKFGLSRMKFRELAHRGLLPGVAKASW